MNPISLPTGSKTAWPTASNPLAHLKGTDTYTIVLAGIVRCFAIPFGDGQTLVALRIKEAKPNVCLSRWSANRDVLLKRVDHDVTGQPMVGLEATDAMFAVLALFDRMRPMIAVYSMTGSVNMHENLHGLLQRL